MTKNTVIIFLTLLSNLLVTSCMKDRDEDFYFTEPLVEFDIATTTAKAPGRNYPLLPARPKDSGIATYKINLLGRQLDIDQQLSIRLVAEGTTAIEGVHYSLPQGNLVTLPANSSTAEFQINVLNFPSQNASTPTVAVFEIVGNEIVKPSQNYKAIGVQISIR